MGVKIADIEMESMIHDGVEVQTWIHDGVEVYTDGKMVTYMVDSGVSYQEKVKKGQSCLSPTTFTPEKSGWTFAGWREDSTASGSVLSSKVMERSPITLYAVFKQTITLSYNGNGATSGSTASQTGTRYYNNGNINNPSFTLRSNGFGRTYYNFQKWALNSASGTQYSVGDSITLSGNSTMYAIWTAATNYKSISISTKAYISNWISRRTLVPYGCVFASTPTIALSNTEKVGIVYRGRSFCIIQGQSDSNKTIDVTVTISGDAYVSNSVAGYDYATGKFTVSANNWQGGSINVSFGKTFKSPPTVNWYNYDTNFSDHDYPTTFSNITTTGCTISWSATSGSGSENYGWAAEGPV